MRNFKATDFKNSRDLRGRSLFREDMVVFDNEKKFWNVTPANIRGILKKEGFKVGHWSSNGRISGLSDFHSGDISVSEAFLGTGKFAERAVEIENGKTIENNFFGTFVGVEISPMTKSAQETIGKIESLLKEKGFDVERKAESLIVM